jgi:hypothetical protein
MPEREISNDFFFPMLLGRLFKGLLSALDELPGGVKASISRTASFSWWTLSLASFPSLLNLNMDLAANQVMKSP